MRLEITIDGTPMTVTLDAEENIDSIRIGGVEVGPLLDLVSGSSRQWWNYLNAVVDRELHAERREAADRLAYDRLEARNE